MRSVGFPLVVMLYSTFTPVAGAQIIRAAPGNPSVFVQSSIGFMQAETIFDGSSGAAWDFGSALQFRVSLEKSIGQGSSVGVAVARASMPLNYNVLRSGDGTTGCTDPNAIRCSAEATLTTLGLTFTASGTTGFHQVLNLNAGVNILDDFREDGTGKELAPIGGDKDLYISAGFGAGYGISNHFAVTLVQDAGFLLHQRTGLEGDRNDFHRVLITRLSLRIAFGK
jgi:hypothetical protein